MCLLNLNVIGATDLVHICHMNYEYKLLDTVIGRIVNAQSMQIGHTVLDRDVFYDIFESASLFL